MYEASNDEFPLMLKLCPAETLSIVVTEALNELTLLERFKMGPDLARAIGLRAEALLAEGMDVNELDQLLDVEDVTEAADIVRPYLTV
jgi:hypothetical protein